MARRLWSGSTTKLKGAERLPNYFRVDAGFLLTVHLLEPKLPLSSAVRTKQMTTGQAITFETKICGKWTKVSGRVAYEDAYIPGHFRIVGRSEAGKRVQFDTAHHSGLYRSLSAQ